MERPLGCLETAEQSTLFPSLSDPIELSKDLCQRAVGAAKAGSGNHVTEELFARRPCKPRAGYCLDPERARDPPLGMGPAADLLVPRVGAEGVSPLEAMETATQAPCSKLNRAGRPRQ
jgi:hypothetical protein